jgi:disintegrin and metalloproteinase domain-containing protein 10
VEGECQDICCIQPTTDDGCRLAENAACSPSFSECCESDCTAKGTSTDCGKADECAQPRTCTQPSVPGAQIKCPDPEPVENGKLCMNNSKTCLDGSCKGSVCYSFEGFEPCNCAAKSLAKPETVNCVICCRPENGGVDTCKPIDEMEEASDVSDIEFVSMVAAGEMCTSNDGYCDVFHRCRLYGEEGFLLTVIKNLFSREKWSKLASNYWWAMILVVVVVFLVIGMFVHLTAIYTPTQNPNLKDKKYQGPTHYVKKQVSVMQAKRQESREQSRDYPDGARPKSTPEEVKQKRLNKYAAKKRRVMVQSPPSGAPLAPVAALESVI